MHINRRRTQSIEGKCNVLLSFVSIDGQKQWVNISWDEWMLFWLLHCAQAVWYWIQHLRCYVWQWMKCIMKYSSYSHHTYLINITWPTSVDVATDHKGLQLHICFLIIYTVHGLLRNVRGSTRMHWSVTVHWITIITTHCEFARTTGAQ